MKGRGKLGRAQGSGIPAAVQDGQLKPGLLVPTVQRSQSLKEIQKLGTAFGDDMLPIIHRHFPLLIDEGEGAPAQETTGLNEIYPISPVQQIHRSGNAGDATAQNHYFWACIQ